MNARETAALCLQFATPACIVEVAHTQGSVPRETGTRMLVTTKHCTGTIGGGHLEWQAIALARERLAETAGAPGWEPFERHYPLGPALGQCCGGTVTLRFAPLTTESLAAWLPETPVAHLLLFGAGHVGRAIAAQLEHLPWSVDWIDERDDEFAHMRWVGPAWPSHIRRVAVDAPEGEVASAPPGAHYLVLTHQHDLDLRICEAVMRRDDVAWLGLIGSRTKRARFVHRFEARGFPQERIARMACPIGLPGITGKAPAVIAVAVVAQLLQQQERQHAGGASRPPACT